IACEEAIRAFARINHMRADITTPEIHGNVARGLADRSLAVLAVAGSGMLNEIGHAAPPRPVGAQVILYARDRPRRRDAPRHSRRSARQRSSTASLPSPTA